MNNKLFLILFLCIICIISLVSVAWSGSLLYSTFLGGNVTDFGQGIAIDSAGNAYITGYTDSHDFPVSPTGFSTTLRSSTNSNVFVSKLNASGSALLYSTYLGGSIDDEGYGIAIDSAGDAFVTGYTLSPNFPVTSNALSTTFIGGSNSEAFVSELNSTGTSLLYSTFLGGSGGDQATGIAVDISGFAYVAGYTGSADFPITSNGLETIFNGAPAFVSKIDTTLPGKSSLVYSTFLGGNNIDAAYAIAVDTNGNAYITGNTQSGNFPVTSNAYDTILNFSNAFMSEIATDSSGKTSLVYSTYLGGSNGDQGNGIAVDEYGNAYITGQTGSTDFPVTANAFQTLNKNTSGGNIAFVSRINTKASGKASLYYSTYLGGSGGDYGTGIAVDSFGNAYVTGYTYSNDFPVTANGLETTNNGAPAFVSKIATNSSGVSSLAYSTYLGANGADEGNGIAVDSFGDAYVTGITSSPNFPVTANAYDTTLKGFQNVFVTALATNPPQFTTVPSLKLFLDQSLDSVFDLSDYNSGAVATNYSIVSSFLTLTTLTGSLVYQAQYPTSTVGTNVYEMNNTIESSTASNLVKYSYFKIQKLPAIGLNPGSSWNINVASYTLNESGPVLSSAHVDVSPMPYPFYPNSFGNVSALIVSDPSLVNATWLDSTSISITALSGFTSGNPVSVDVIASSLSSPPYTDMDKERVRVYPNLLAHGSFDTGSDTTAWSPMEIPPGRSTMASQQWISSYTDSAGTQANGVWQFIFADTTNGVKATPTVSNWIHITDGQWYTFRIRLVADTPNNSHSAFLYGYTNYPGAGTQTDIVGNILFGVPTVWTWQEAPLLAHGSSTTGYPQFQLKSGGTGSIYVDEVQIINAAPALAQARSNPYYHYFYGQFTAGYDTTGWGQELYNGAGSAPSISINNGLILDFTGAGSGSSQKGIKWTANNGVQGQGNAYSIPVNLNRDVDVRLTLAKLSGNFNSLGIVLLAAYGVQTEGQQNIAIPPSNLIASAGVGILNSGDYFAEGNAINPYYQGQFGIRSDQSGILMVTDVDVGMDNDDPNFGDATLFP